MGFPVWGKEEWGRRGLILPSRPPHNFNLARVVCPGAGVHHAGPVALPPTSTSAGGAGRGLPWPSPPPPSNALGDCMNAVPQHTTHAHPQPAHIPPQGWLPPLLLAPFLLPFSPAPHHRPTTPTGTSKRWSPQPPRKKNMFRHLSPAQLRQWVQDHPGHVDDRDRLGEIALYIAARKGDVVLLEWLLDSHGAAVDGRVRDWSTALHVARTPRHPSLAGPQCGH